MHMNLCVCVWLGGWVLGLKLSSLSQSTSPLLYWVFSNGVSGIFAQADIEKQFS
jgi:hypothetical protein